MGAKRRKNATKPTLKAIARAQARLERMRDEAQPESERPIMGRPTVWSTDLEGKLLSRMSKGRTLSAICRDDADMPDILTVFRWREKDPDFLDRLVKVRRLQSHVLVDQTLEIADNAVPDKDRVAVDRLRIGTRQWIAERFNREDYGQTPTQNVQINGPIQINTDERVKILEELRNSTIDVTPQLTKEKS